ncbi:MAG: TIR domain-containing protein [Blastocatellia bacterium]
MPEDFEATLKQPILVFCSYSHRDEALRDELSKHLSGLKRPGFILEWHDRLILPGEKWAAAIDDQINRARVILLLISPDFLDSDYCHEIEMKRALERERNGEAIVIPVILRSCDWKGSLFGHLQVLPKDARAVTSWPNQDEAFTNIAKGIRAIVEQLREETASPPAPPKPRRPDFDQYEEEIRRQEVKEIKVANPYLLGEKFAGRKKELGDLTDWLVEDENKILCICDLGGTGKSALVWHWLNHPATRDTLAKRGMRQFWCSFYARNFDSMQFLRDLAAQLGGATVVESDPWRAQMELQREVLDRLRKGKWLLVLDGLEREMGAFANPEHYQVDSEEQDRRNEKGEVLVEEKYIRGHVFADFLRQLLHTQTKVLITSRIFPENLRPENLRPENLKSGERPLPGVVDYPFRPMSPEDAAEVWALSCKPEDSPIQREFFASAGFHPQVISVVAAAVNEQGMCFSDWLGDFSEAERQACLDPVAPLTVRRHRWLELATRDLIRHRRNAWLTICYIVRRSEASSVDALMNGLVDRSSAAEARPGRFSSDEKLREVLDYLMKRRLIGVDLTRGQVDVHPVIRGQVMQYILKQYEQGGRNDEDLVRHLESGDDFRNLLVRFLNQPDLEDRFQSLSSVLEGFSAIPSGQRSVLNILGTFYAGGEPGGRPWMEALPALRLRKEQAWVLLRTGNELMTRGLWDESAAVFNRASLAYQLCGDLQSVEDCRHSHNWQALYGGGLWQAERLQLDALEKGGSKHAEYTEYWLMLLLSIRQSEHAAELLQSLPAETNRWTLQTVAEARFYLKEYDEAIALARQAWDRRESEPDAVGQTLWEAVTLGLALVRLDRFDEAEPFLDFAKSRGTGWAYNLVPMFALAGLIELHYRKAMKSGGVSDRRDQLSRADLVYKQYCKSDPTGSFQIPAAEVHLAMARVHLARQERGEALELARRALAVARGKNPPFHYASVVGRATQLLTEELEQPGSPIEDLSLEALDHEDRLQAWMMARKGER